LTLKRAAAQGAVIGSSGGGGEEEKMAKKKEPLGLNERPDVIILKIYQIY
jgi:hypothetical protein